MQEHSLRKEANHLEFGIRVSWEGNPQQWRYFKDYGTKTWILGFHLIYSPYCLLYIVHFICKKNILFEVYILIYFLADSHILPLFNIFSLDLFALCVRNEDAINFLSDNSSNIFIFAGWKKFKCGRHLTAFIRSR